MKRVTIQLRTNVVNVVVEEDKAHELLDQFYDIVSEEITDNCFEIVSKNELDITETILVRASEIIYIKSADE